MTPPAPFDRRPRTPRYPLMAATSITTQASGAGLSLAFTQQVSANVVAALNPAAPLPVAKTGTLSTRGGNAAGTLTMAAGHGIATGNRLDVFWTDPTTGAQKCQHKCTVGTVSGTSVPISGGTGDNLPAQDAAITAAVPTPLDFPFVPGDLLSLAVCGSGPGKIVFEKGDGTVVFHQTLNATGGGFAWASVSGASNPVSDTVAVAYLSNGSSAAANNIQGFAGLTG